MMQSLNLSQTIHGNDGYSCALQLSTDEVETLYQFIRVQWLYRLQLLVPEHVRVFDELGMQNYHECADLFDHASAWPKTSRVLPREAGAIIKKMPFFQKLVAEFGEFNISDEENFGWENFSWRLARPQKEDYGSIHTDKWFSDLGYYGKNTDLTLEPIKVWIPIFVTPGKNGLLVVPGSHTNKNWKWHIETKQGREKPVLDEDLNDLNVCLLKTNPGQAVIFHDELLHGGAPNEAMHTRVSMEFTIYVKKNNNA